MSKINCAVYTRKSTEKGLDMEFNSLQNQEEACKAYILSQAFHNWEYYKTYSDGGISGGTMERPGLQRLLEDIRAGQIQVVVVYKVDRLSRSIFDFHRMMQEFDKYNCNFVSITQSFDTSNSMGKLTLNMLLSFAQFEREVSAERVRDKIAASKAKGMWMGGIPPLGYDIENKQLIPNKTEAVLVNRIFQKYLEVGNIREVAEWLNRQGYQSKSWKRRDGHLLGGSPFEYGPVKKILSNPVYIGKIAYLAQHKVYSGKHKAILPKELFEAVQTKLGATRDGFREYRRYMKSKTLLADILFDESGTDYKLTACKKGKQKLQYYFIPHGPHISASQLDSVVLSCIQQADYSAVVARTTAESINNHIVKRYLNKVTCQKIDKTCYIAIYLEKEPFISYLEQHHALHPNAGDYVAEIHNQWVIIKNTFYIDNLTSTRLQNGSANNIVTIHQLNESLVRGLARAWQLKKLLEKGLNTRECGKESKLNKRTFSRYLNLCFLSPKIITDILEYKNPRHMSLKELMNLAEGETEFKKQAARWSA